VGVDPPVDPLYFQKASACGQDQVREHSDCDHRHGRRRCLLKGCEGWFEPARPQCRYCGDACRQAARAWSCWRAQGKYRQSEAGRECRREQSRQYRERRPAREAEPGATTQIASPVACEGHHHGEFWTKSENCPCDRPGCYVLFEVTPHQPPKRFCSAACREALRRVEERERRFRERRRCRSCAQ
jgi:hypothetical protein